MQSKLLEKPLALKNEHQALQKMKFINCFIFFWAIFALLDPDPDCESGYRDSIECGSTTLVRTPIRQHYLQANISREMVILSSEQTAV
jgi:hypothetical protein